MYNYGWNQARWWPIRFENFDIDVIIIIIIIIIINIIIIVIIILQRCWKKNGKDDICE